MVFGATESLGILIRGVVSTMNCSHLCDGGSGSINDEHKICNGDIRMDAQWPTPLQN